MFKKFFSKKKLKAQSTTEELVERGFAPQNGKIHILLINPPSTISERYGRKDIGEVGGDMIPLGIACLAGYLREKGYGVGVLDCPTLRIDADKVYEIIKQKDPAIIGFSTTTYALTRAIDIADKIRNKLPTKLTVIGGSHTNVAGIETANEYGNYFDIIAYGLDGEYIIHNIVKKYSENNFNRDLFLKDFQTLENIKGIIFKKNNVAVRNKPSEVIENLDDLPFPARDLFPTERYMPLPNNYKQLPATNMIVIRGCPYFCTFCDQAGTGARRRSPHKVIEEIKNCVENYGIREISFWDDTMSYHKKWMNEFCNLLIEAKLDIIWSCYAAVNTVNQEILYLMKKAGCWNIFYGYETGVPELAENIKTNRKNKSMEYMMKVARWTKNAGIEVRGSFMIALPGENPELAEQTIQDAIKLDPEYAQFSITTPYPGTALYDEIKKGKWGKLTTEDFSEFQGWNVVFLPEGYKNKEEVMKMNRKAFRTFYLRPRYIIKAILNIRSLEDIKRYFIGFKALVKGFV